MNGMTQMTLESIGMGGPIGGRRLLSQVVKPWIQVNEKREITPMKQRKKWRKTWEASSPQSIYFRYYLWFNGWSRAVHMYVKQRKPPPQKNMKPTTKKAHE